MSWWKKDLPLDQLNDIDLLKLVNDKVQEDEQLEYKSTPWNLDDNDRFELLQDITGMANGLGGYIIIGIGTRKSNGKDAATGFAKVAKNTKYIQRIRDICFHLIDPRINGLEIGSKIVEWRFSKYDILIVRIPPSSERPHAFEWSDSTVFVRRYGEHVRQMPVSELGQMLSVRFFPDTQTSQEIATLSSQVSDLREQIASIADTLVKLQSRPPDGNSDPLDQTSAENVLSIMGERFRKKLGESE